MKRLSKIVPILCIAVMLLLLTACQDNESGDNPGGSTSDNSEWVDLLGRPTQPFFIDWQNGNAKKEYEAWYFYDGKTDWYEILPDAKYCHEFRGIYSEKNGQGERVIDSVGNLLTKDIIPHATYYAYWVEEPIFLQFRFSSNIDGITFDDGSQMISKEYRASDLIDFSFPEVIGAEVLYWKNNRGEAISDGNILSDSYLYISDLITQDSPYLNFYPVLNIDTCILTLDIGTNVLDYEVQAGEPIGKYLKDNKKNLGGREIVGWSTDRYETQSFINEGKIYADTTLFAVWKNYSEITLVGVDENYFDDGYALPHEDSRKDNPFCVKHIYEYEPEYLQAPVKSGYVFLGWYDNPEFEGEPISRLASYELNSGTYYACMMKEFISVQIEYTDDNSRPRKTTVKFYPDETLRYRLDFSSLAIGKGRTVTGVYNNDERVVDENGYWLLDGEPSQYVSEYYDLRHYRNEYIITLYYQVPNSTKFQFIDMAIRLVNFGDGCFLYEIKEFFDELPDGLSMKGIYFDTTFESLAFDENGVSTRLFANSELYIKVSD